MMYTTKIVHYQKLTDRDLYLRAARKEARAGDMKKLRLLYTEALRLLAESNDIWDRACAQNGVEWTPRAGQKYVRRFLRML